MNDPWEEIRAAEKLKKDAEKQARIYHITTTGMIHMAKPSSKPLQRIQYICSQEEETLNEIINAEQEQRINQLRHENEEKLARALQEEREKIECENTRRINLRKTVPELRELQSQLRAAYVAKMQAAQRMDKIQREQAEKNKDDPSIAEMKEKWKEDDRKALEAEEKKWKEKRELFKTLKYQLDNNFEKQMLAEERRQEREEVDRILKLTAESLKKQKEDDRLKKREAYLWYLKHLKAKDENNEKLNQIEAVEEQKRQQFKEEVYKREDVAKKLRQEARENAEKLHHKLASELGGIQQAEHDRQKQCQEIAELLDEIKYAQITDDSLQKKKMMRKELSDTMYMQMEEKRQRQEAEMKAELEYRALLKKLYEEEQERAKKFGLSKRAKMMKYKGELEICEAQRKQHLQEVNQRELQEAQAIKDDYADFRAQVEAERQAMIKEMAPHLLPGCIGRNVLRKSDIDSLSTELRGFIQSKPIWPPSGD